MKKYILWALLSALLSFPTVAVSYTQDARDVWINNLAICESGLRDVTVLDSNKKYSYGVLQFQMATWVSYGRTFGATRQNIHDAYLQHKVARSMLDQGLESNWLTCARKVTKKYGAYPVYAPTVMSTGDVL